MFPLYYTVHTENTVNFHNPSLSISSSLPSSSLNYQRSLPPLSPFSRHQVLLPSFFSIFPSLSVYLSVCLSVTRHFTRSLTRSVSHTSENHSHSPRSLTRSLTRSRSHTGWVSFFFYSIHSDCTYVTTWNCRVEHLLQSLPLHFFLYRKKRARKPMNEKKANTYDIFNIKSDKFFLL